MSIYDEYKYKKLKISVIFPCAGSGDRFIPLSKVVNKCLMIDPINSNKDKISFVLNSHIVGIQSAISNMSSGMLVDEIEVYPYLISTNGVEMSEYVYTIRDYFESKNWTYKNTKTEFYWSSSENIKITEKMKSTVLPDILDSNRDTVAVPLSSILDDSGDSEFYRTLNMVIITDPTVICTNIITMYEKLIISQYSKLVNNIRNVPSLVISTSKSNSEEYYMRYLNRDISNKEVTTCITNNPYLEKGYSVSIASMSLDTYINIIRASKDNPKYWDDQLYVTKKVYEVEYPNIDLILANCMEFDTVNQYKDAVNTLCKDDETKEVILQALDELISEGHSEVYDRWFDDRSDLIDS